MGDKDFVHLHLHTEYSLLDGSIRIGSLCDRILELGMPAVAMTDHGNMFGTVDFYQKVDRAGIKPIIGCEVYVAPASRLDRSAQRIREASYHLILLVENERGYCRLEAFSETSRLLCRSEWDVSPYIGSQPAEVSLSDVVLNGPGSS